MMENTFKVGIYLRLSREDEKNTESVSIKTQRDLLLNYIKDNNLLYVDEYVDDGVSGTTFDRAGFNKMIKDCETKKINMIITKDTSRLGRDHIEFGYYVERYFPEHNIRFVAVNDGIDTFNNNTANDMLIFKSAFNDMYVKDISNKLRSSLYTKKRNGLFVGCYAPYGYKKSDNDKHKLIVDEEIAVIVKRIFNMFINEKSVSEICNTLTNEGIKTPSMQKGMKLGQKNLHYGDWSQRTVTDILKNQIYIGNLCQCKQKKVNYKSKKRVHNKESDWLIAKNVVEPIIDNKTFELVQSMFKSNKNKGKKNTITSNLLLKGLVYCKECKHSIGFKENKQFTKKYGLQSRIYGNCNYWVKHKKYCTPHSIKYKYIEDIVMNDLKYRFKKYLDLDYMNSFFNNCKNIRNKKEDLIDKINKVEIEINNINRKIDNMYNDKLDGNITIEVYSRIYDKLNNEIKELQNKKKEYIDKLNDSKTNEEILKISINYLDLKNPNKLLINSLIEKIEIDENKNIFVYYKFKNCKL